MSNKAIYQRVLNGDNIEADVIRIWWNDGELVAVTVHPERSECGYIIIEPMSVERALDEALARQENRTIYVQIDDEADWRSEWGHLLPAVVSTS